MYIDTMTEPYTKGRWLIFTKDSVASTQVWVRERVAALSDRSVVLAGTQSTGRGRSGREWKSPPGGFYASFLLKPSPPLASAPCVSLLAAVVLVRLLKKQGITASVKWPNDVIVNDRKIAGIIAEAGSFPESWFVLGMGVNLTCAPLLQDRKFLPAGCWTEFGDPPSADRLLNEFLVEFDVSWSNKEDDPMEGISGELNSILWRKGEQVSLSGGGDIISGIISRVDHNGSLVLLTDSGEERFVSGELRTVPDERR